MSDSYFTLLESAPDLSRFAASEHTVGPWSPELQHGGPPSSLTVTVAARAIRNATGREDLAPRRVAVDFVGAVPVAEFTVGTRVVRAARSAALVEASITSGGRECLSARVWFVRDADTAHIAMPPVAPPAVPERSDSLGIEFGYGASVQWRYVHGALGTPGPAAVWARPTMPLVPGWDYNDLARVALIADSASGISAELDWNTWSFVNVDLDLHVVRPVEGEWILLDAVTQLGPSGAALARSTISDVTGTVGAGLQTLVLAPLPTR